MSAAAIFARTNEATSINTSDADLRLTSHGSDWYWAVFAVFGVLTLYHAIVVAVPRKSNRLLNVGPLYCAAVEFFVYFTMASNLGWTDTQAEFNHVTVSDSSMTPGLRQVFYARYVGWFLSWPPLMFALELLLTHQQELLTWKTMTNFAIQIGAIETYVLGLLIGILIPSSYRWGYFTFALVAQLFAICFIYIRMFCLETVTTRRLYTFGGFSFLTLIWILYPIAWGLSEGGNVIQVDSDAAFYGVLDIILFGFIPFAISFFPTPSPPVVANTAPTHYPTTTKSETGSTEHRHSGETAIHPSSPEAEAAEVTV